MTEMRIEMTAHPVDAEELREICENGWELVTETVIPGSAVRLAQHERIWRYIFRRRQR